MDIVVLVKGVPDFREGKVQFKEDNTLNRGATPTVLNPNDKFALEAAREVQIKHGGTVHVMSMGPPNYGVILKQAMAIAGDKLYLLSDVKFAGADTWATAYALSSGIKKIGTPELVIAGFKTADGETGQTGPQTALILERPIVTHVSRLVVHEEEGTFRAHRVLPQEIEVCEGPLPGFIVTDPAFEATYTKASERLELLDHMEAQKAKVEDYESYLTVWNAEGSGAPQDKIGLKGSPTIVRAVDPIPVPPKMREAKVYLQVTDDQLEEIAHMIAEKVA